MYTQRPQRCEIYRKMLVKKDKDFVSYAQNSLNDIEGT